MGAKGAPYVETVHLYGSRDKGSARPDSDVDLASTASVGNYVRFADEWQRDLSDALKLLAELETAKAKAATTIKLILGFSPTMNHPLWCHLRSNRALVEHNAAAVRSC